MLALMTAQYLCDIHSLLSGVHCGLFNFGIGRKLTLCEYLSTYYCRVGLILEDFVVQFTVVNEKIMKLSRHNFLIVISTVTLWVHFISRGRLDPFKLYTERNFNSSVRWQAHQGCCEPRRASGRAKGPKGLRECPVRSILMIGLKHEVLKFY